MLPSMPWKTVKIVIVGDGAVGKTSLVFTYVEDTFPGEYIPYVAEGCSKSQMVNGKPLTLELWDTPAQDGYDKLRPLAYLEKDVVFICFSIAEPTSLQSVAKKWYPEAAQHRPANALIFLVGTKLDLRNDEKIIESLKSRGLAPVTTSQGLEMKEAIGACRYVECSSLTRENLETLFDEVMQAVPNKRKNKRCRIL